MRQDWLESGTPLIDFRVYSIGPDYKATYLARVWYPAYLEATSETVRKDLLACGWFGNIEVIPDLTGDYYAA